jgi:hypothetical protein
MPTKNRPPSRRFGIGEWYGKPFHLLPISERQKLAELELLTTRGNPAQECPFLSTGASHVMCNKSGGVCSLRLYERDAASGAVALTQGDTGRLRTVCPSRFEEGRLIYQWVGETVLGTPDVVSVREVGFLERIDAAGSPAKDDVGRIDRVLVIPGSSPLQWCALEVQAVYFSGGAMRPEWEAIRQHQESSLPFPANRRRPDYRSSGPKRLMPQLQIKVPSLRRWGKKMAVVVDEDFWEALGPMDSVNHVANCDIVWFIVGYDETLNEAKLALRQTRLTTLERAVEGLTAGLPVSLGDFEKRILAKIQA